MTAYKGFAGVYDKLMQDAPYDEWVKWVDHSIKMEELKAPRLLDVGCGTGTIMEKLLDKEYFADGMDLSEDMLAVAKNKLISRGYVPVLLCQDMRYIDINIKYDVILVLCDSLNYLVTVEDLQKAFQSFYQHLNEGGLLLFDVHSLPYIKNVLQEVSFADNADDVAYIWNTFATENIGEVEHELTFFIEKEGSLYERYDETHKQRTFSIETYQSLLENAGFQARGIHGDFSFEAPFENSDRIFFTAKKILQKPENKL